MCLLFTEKNLLLDFKSSLWGTSSQTNSLQRAHKWSRIHFNKAVASIVNNSQIYPNLQWQEACVSLPDLHIIPVLSLRYPATTLKQPHGLAFASSYQGLPNTALRRPCCLGPQVRTSPSVSSPTMKASIRT